jgi:cation transport protein ChaC
VKPSAESLRSVLAAVEHLGDDGLPAYPPRRPWPCPQPGIADAPLWVFGYGSLIWHPGFPFEEARIARVHGHHRALCIWSWEYRGTTEVPGLVLGLDRGGSCTGVAFRVGEAEREATVAYLLRRELTTPIYRPVRKPALLDDGRRVRVLTFVVERGSEQYAGRPGDARTVQVVASARGRRGPNAEYVQSTVQHLDELGIPCRRLRRIARALPAAGAAEQDAHGRQATGRSC